MVHGPYIPKLPVIVVTRDGEGDRVDARTINYRDASDRKWLTSHTYWALNNSHSVALSPA